MVTITRSASRQMFERVGKKVEAHPTLLSRMGGKGTTSNGEILSILKELYPIGNPLIPEVQGRLLESFGRPIMVSDEIVAGGQCLLHMWYGALTEERTLSGQNIPLLDRDLVEQRLPALYVPPGKTICIHMNAEEYQAMEGFLEPIQGILVLFAACGGGAVSAAFLYPIHILMWLMNNASQATGKRDL